MTILAAILNTLWQAVALTCFVWVGTKWTRPNAATRSINLAGGFDVDSDFADRAALRSGISLAADCHSGCARNDDVSTPHPYPLVQESGTATRPGRVS